jgi:hypothetical protein
MQGDSGRAFDARAEQMRGARNRLGVTGQSNRDRAGVNVKARVQTAGGVGAMTWLDEIAMR